MKKFAIICVKLGTKYSSEMVNNLYRMCQRSISSPFDFFCYTDDPTGLQSQVNVISYIDHNLDIIVYNKLVMFCEWFDNQLPDCTRVYFDLDIVIKDNIDHVLECDNKDLTLIDAEWREKHSWGFPMFHHHFNSSCMVWQTPNTRAIWDHFIKDPEFFMNKYRWGMDSFLFYEYKNAGVTINTFPSRLFYSFMYGVDFMENILHDPEIQGYRPSKFVHIVKKIPVALFNGPTDPADYWKIYREHYGV